MNFNQTQRFVIGALQHGMTFEDAFALMTQAGAQRKQNRQAKKSALSDLITQGVEWSMQEGADPALVASAVAATGAAQGLKRPQLKQALSTLGVTDQGIGGVIGAAGGGVDPETLTTWSDDFAAYEPEIKKMLEEGKGVSEIRQTLAPQLQREALALGQSWSEIGPHINQMLDAAVYRNIEDPAKQQEFNVRKQLGAQGLSAEQQDAVIKKLLGGGEGDGGAGAGLDWQGKTLAGLATAGAGVGAVQGFRGGQGMGRLSALVKGGLKGSLAPVTSPSVMTRPEWSQLKQLNRLPKIGAPLSGGGSAAGAPAALSQLGEIGARVASGTSMVGVPQGFSDPRSPYFGGEAPEGQGPKESLTGAMSWEPPELRDKNWFEKSPAGSLWSLAKGLF